MSDIEILQPPYYPYLVPDDHSSDSEVLVSGPPCRKRPALRTHGPHACTALVADETNFWSKDVHGYMAEANAAPRTPRASEPLRWTIVCLLVLQWELVFASDLDPEGARLFPLRRGRLCEPWGYVQYMIVSHSPEVGIGVSDPNERAGRGLGRVIRACRGNNVCEAFLDNVGLRISDVLVTSVCFGDGIVRDIIKSVCHVVPLPRSRSVNPLRTFPSRRDLGEFSRLYREGSGGHAHGSLPPERHRIHPKLSYFTTDSFEPRRVLDFCRVTVLLKNLRGLKTPVFLFCGRHGHQIIRLCFRIWLSRVSNGQPSTRWYELAPALTWLLC